MCVRALVLAPAIRLIIYEVISNTQFFMLLLHAWTIGRYTRSPVVDSPSASIVGVVYAVYDCVHFCIIYECTLDDMQKYQFRGTKEIDFF